VIERPKLLSPPEPDFARKRPGAKAFLTPSGALLPERSDVAMSCVRATERPLFEKGEAKKEDKKKHATHIGVVAFTIQIYTHQ
jgi:hypothetical protein